MLLCYQNGRGHCNLASPWIRLVEHHLRLNLKPNYPLPPLSPNIPFFFSSSSPSGLGRVYVNSQES